MMFESNTVAAAGVASSESASTTTTTTTTTTTSPLTTRRPLPLPTQLLLSPPPPPTVCVIGGGPGAMSICHALETQKKQMIEKGEDISQFPSKVKCFERSPGPGGVWRSDRTHGQKKKNGESSHHDEEKNEDDDEKNVNVNEDEDEDSSIDDVSVVNVVIDMDATDITDSSASAADHHHHLDLILPSSSSTVWQKNKKLKMFDSNDNDNDNDNDEETIETSTMTTSFTSSSSSTTTAAAEGVVAEATETGSTTTGTTAAESDKTNMYSALWTNGHKEAYEFYDYTFVDHFGYDVASKLPTYIPRKLVLEYLLARCTKNCPDFFENYFSFQTTVLNVKYIEEDDEEEEEEEDGSNEQQHKNKFQITVQDETTGIISIEYYDKCIWAGGNEGVPFIPGKTKQLFENKQHCTSSNSNSNSNNSTCSNDSRSSSNNNKSFRVVHSSDTSNFKSDVEGKNVLIIGSGLSAEDLALMAIKEGVNHIDIIARSPKSDLIEGLQASRWPYDKVTVHFQTCVTHVNNNNNEITLTKCEWCNTERKYELWDEEDYEEEGISPTVLTNIDTVIFCTGYEPNLKMLDETLYPFNKSTEDRECKFQVPKGWTMHGDQQKEEDIKKEDDDMNVDDADTDTDTDADDSSSEEEEEVVDEGDYDIEEYLRLLYFKLSKLYFGKNYKQIENDITPSEYVYTSDHAVYATHLDTLYRGTFSIKNTNMMYIMNNETDFPLLEADVTSWMVAKIISKQALLPNTKQDMINENIHSNLEVMKCPDARYEMDASYAKAIDGTYNIETDEHINGDRIKKVSKETTQMIYCNAKIALGKYMCEYDYPVSFVDVYDGADNHNMITATTTTAKGAGIGTVTSYCWSKYFKIIVGTIGNSECDIARRNIDKLEYDDDDNEDNTKNGFWRTFRDHPHTDKFVSYFTGLKSVPLSKRWFDYNEDDKLW